MNQPPLPQDTACIFLHIPKTAGSTLSEVIQRNYRPGQWRDFGRQPPAVMARALQTFAHEPAREKLRFLMGHVPFGTHHLLPLPASYITFLRDPVARELSLYYFIISEPMHFRHESLVSRRATLDEFLDEQVALGLDNLQTRYLTAANLREDFWNYLAEPRPLPVNAVQMARENMKQLFALVGTTERFDECLLICQKLFGWKSIKYSRENVTHKGPRYHVGARRDVPDAAIQRIREINQLDLQLFEEVQQSLEDRLRAEGPRFAEQVQRFRAENALHARRQFVRRGIRALRGRWAQLKRSIYRP